MTKASDYKHIRAWGALMGSFEYYIRNEQDKAALDNAPVDAVYQSSNGVWIRHTDVGDVAFERVKQYLKDNA